MSRACGQAGSVNLIWTSSQVITPAATGTALHSKSALAQEPWAVVLHDFLWNQKGPCTAGRQRRKRPLEAASPGSEALCLSSETSRTSSGGADAASERLSEEDVASFLASRNVR